MSQQNSPWVEAKYGWNLGESGWNGGMDENLLKFSFLFDGNIDGVVSLLPPEVNGKAYYLTTDNRLYFVVNGTYYSTVVPKWFTVTDRTTGDTYQFDGTSLQSVANSSELNTRVAALEVTSSSLGSAAFEDSSVFATSVALSDYQSLLSSTAGSQEISHKQNTLSDIFDGQGVVTGLDPTGAVPIDAILQSALNSQRIVRLPPGNFRLSSKITLNSNNVLVGSGMEATRIFRDTSVAPFDFFEAISSQDIAVKDVWLDNVQKEIITIGTNRRSAIRFWDNGSGIRCKGVSVIGVRFSKFSSAENQPEGIRGVITFEETNTALVTGCRFDDNRATGVIWWAADDVRVHDNQYDGEIAPFDPFGPVGSFVSGWAEGTQVTSNRCTGSAYSTINCSGRGIVISNNVIDSPGYSGIGVAELVPAATDIAITGNTIRDPGLDGIYMAEVDGFAITGNTVKNATSAARGGIYLASTIAGNCPVNGTISGNNLMNCAAGIRAQGGQSISVGNNRFSNNVIGILASNRVTAAMLLFVKSNVFSNNSSYAAQFGDVAQTATCLIYLEDNTFYTSDIATLQATGIVTQSALTTLRLGANNWDTTYTTEFVETVFANRATKAFLNLAGTLTHLKRTIGLPIGATTAYAGSGSIADGAGVNVAVTVTNAVVGDKVTWSHSTAIPVGILVEAFVTASGTVTVRFQNESGAAATVPAGNLSVSIVRG